MSLLFTTVMHISFYFHIQLEIEEVKKIIKMKIFLIFDFTFDMLLWLLLHAISDACCTFVTIARDQQVKQNIFIFIIFLLLQ